ncbi:MAG TPA: hypothetical protein VMP01_28950 [Pirellulaceae bacterium]|nr:hypothetical protein [Pirellulaceae bacterium]
MTDASNRDGSPSWPRWAARASLAAAFVCFAMNCVFMQLTRRQLPSETELANQIVGWASLAVLIAGIIAGAAAIIGGWKEPRRETLVLAAMGILLSGGIIGVTLWLLYQISQAAS